MPQAPSGSGQRSLRTAIGRVAAASAVAQFFTEIVAVVQTVALARLLTPVEVGFFAAGSVFTSFLDNFVEGGLRSGLVHRRDELEDAAETVFWATLTMGALLSVAGLLTAPLVAAVFDNRTAGLVAAAMAGGLLLTSLTNVPEALLQRVFSVRRRLVVAPAVATTFAVVSVSLAAAGLGVWSLVIGELRLLPRLGGRPLVRLRLEARTGARVAPALETAGTVRPSARAGAPG